MIESKHRKLLNVFFVQLHKYALALVRTMNSFNVMCLVAGNYSGGGTLGIHFWTSPVSYRLYLIMLFIFHQGIKRYSRVKYLKITLLFKQFSQTNFSHL